MLDTLVSAAALSVLGLAFLTLLGLVTATVTRSVSGYFAASSTSTLSDSDGVTANPTVLAAQPGVLTTHTTDTTGSLTMTNSAHGIITGQRIDVYWAGGQCYGAVAGTVSGNVVPIASVSGGADLPASSTAVTVGIPVSAAFNVVGNNLTMLAAVPGAGQAAYFVWNNGSADQLAQFVTAGGSYEWDNSQGSSSPLAGNAPTVVWIGHNNAANAVTSCIASALTH